MCVWVAFVLNEIENRYRTETEGGEVAGDDDNGASASDADPGLDDDAGDELDDEEDDPVDDAAGDDNPEGVGPIDARDTPTGAGVCVYVALEGVDGALCKRC